jgi:hypothetical protein
MYPENDQVSNELSRVEYEGDATASRSSVAVSELAAAMESEPSTSGFHSSGMLTYKSGPAPSASSPAVAGLTPIVADHLIREVRLAYEEALSFTAPTYSPTLVRKYAHIMTDLCKANRSWNHPAPGQPYTFVQVTRNAKNFFSRKVILFLPRDQWCHSCANQHDQFVNDPATRNKFFWPCAVVDDPARCVACDLYRLDGIRETPPEAGPFVTCSHKRIPRWTDAKYQAATTAAAATATAAPPSHHGPASASASGALTSPSSAGSTQAISDPVLSTSTLPPVACGVAPSPVINPVITTTILTGVGSSIANPIVFDDDDDDDGGVKQPASRVQGTTTQIGESSTNPAERLSTVKTEQSSTVKTEQSVTVKTENANVREKLLAFAKTIEDFVGNMMPGPIASNVKAVATRLKADCAASQPCCEALECAIVGLRAQTIIVVVHQNLGGTLREMEELSETL